MFTCGFSAVLHLEIIMIIVSCHYFTSPEFVSKAVGTRVALLLSVLPLFPTLWSLLVASCAILEGELVWLGISFQTHAGNVGLWL